MPQATPRAAGSIAGRAQFERTAARETAIHDLKWSKAEKALSRRLFEQALHAELAETLADLKAKAAAASEPDDMWAIHELLGARRRDIDRKYDYRYSQLIFVFGVLLRESRIQESQLFGLSQDKQEMIKRFASL